MRPSAEDTLDLAGLLGSRICHDLISPIGAIGNGMELLLMQKAPLPPELALIAESVASANAKIRLFRIAFGAASADQRLTRRELAEIAQGFLQGGRLSLEWQGPEALTRAEAQIAFLALLCLESTLPFGGTLHFGESGGALQLSGRSEKMKLDPALWALLAPGAAKAPAASLRAAEVHFALLQEALTAQGLALTLAQTPGEITLHWAPQGAEENLAEPALGAMP